MEEEELAPVLSLEELLPPKEAAQPAAGAVAAGGALAGCFGFR